MLEVHENARVFTAHDEHLGKVDHIVIDPLTRMVSHIVVRKGIFFPEDKVIPIDVVATATEERINLDQDVDPDRFPPFLEYHYVPLEEPIEDLSASAGTAPAPFPFVWYGPYGVASPTYETTMRTVTERNIPDRAVALEPGIPVLATGRREVGRLEEVILTDFGSATHIVISDDGFNPVRKAIPINWVDAISENEIRLGVVEHMVQSIKPYDPGELPSAG